MNKEFFLSQLEKSLSFLSDEEKKDILSDYEEHFQFGLLNGKSEEEISSNLGYPSDIASEFFESIGKELFTGFLKVKCSNSELIENSISKIKINPFHSPFCSTPRIMSIEPLIPYLKDENSQTLAVIISHMKPSQGAEILQSLPEDKMIEVVMAIATLDQQNKDVLMKIDHHLNKKPNNLITNDQGMQTEGIKTLVTILNNVTRSTEKSLFDQLNKIDAALSNKIKSNMFVFEDIINLDRLSLQKVINKIPDNKLIAKALKLASEDLKEKFYSAMSSGRKQYVDDANDGLPRIRMSDAEEAQKTIANVALRLIQNGEISVIDPNEELTP